MKEIDNTTKELKRLGKEESFGEMSIIDQQPRSASVISTKETTFISINIESEIGKDNKFSDIYVSILQSIGKITSKRLRYTNEVTVQKMAEVVKQQKKQIISGSLTIGIIINVCIWECHL